MKVKIINVPGYSHEYLITETDVIEIHGGYVKKFRLGINKHLFVTYLNNQVVSAEFDTSKKKIQLPISWFEIID